MNKNMKIKIRNRCGGAVNYRIPDLNLFRTFERGEQKELPFDEIQRLAYVPGGEYLLQHSLVIENPEARDEILGHVELEYNYTEKDIENLLNNGSIDALLDCLDFAPNGVINLVKKIAVDTELNDVKKREIIFQKTGFNIDNAIKINKENNDTTEAPKVATRRVVATPTSQQTEESPRRAAFTVTKK